MEQTEEQKKEYIEDSMRVFRETLEKTYLNCDNEFYGIGVNNLVDLQNGNFTRTNKNILKLQIGMSAEQLVKDNIKGLPRKFSEWKAFPIVIWLNNTHS